MAPFRLWDAPDIGRLNRSVSVPLLLVQAWRQQRDGQLLLQRRDERTLLRVRAGAPISVERPDHRGAFGRFLEQTGRIDATQRAEIDGLVERTHCADISATLALKLLEPQALYEAIREHQRGGLVASFDWLEGDYQWLPPDPESARTQGRPFDLLSLLQRELPRCWGPERLFAELRAVQEVGGCVSPLDRKIVQKLVATGTAAARAVAALDESATLGQALGRCAGEPLSAATLWILLHSGLYRPRAQTAQPPTDPDGIEIEIHGQALTPPAPARQTQERSGLGSFRADETLALRREIEQRAAALPSLDHYSLLGLDVDASPSEVKKAYFKAAKRYHPDAIARLGLNDLSASAELLFARVSEAFETLSDPAKRRSYDEGGPEQTAFDTARLARAEAAFRKGEILAQMGRFDGALDYLDAAVELWPEEPAYHALLGWALYKQRSSDAVRAARHLEIALAGSADDALVHFRLGLVMRALGQAARAENLLARARALEPRDGR